MYELTVKSRFAAAHQLRAYQGRCENLHGHNWVVQATLEAASLNQIGLAIDFTEIKKALHEVLDELDHKHLNDLPMFREMNPSSENLSRWICEALAARLDSKDVRVSRVTTWESEDACATYVREH